jgi:methionyl-tRNA formyltransferase
MKKQDLRIVFMGTPDFAVPTLKAIINNGYNVVGVITAPDKEAGRGKKINMSAIKKFAIEHKLKILQPHKLKDENFIVDLRNLKANLQVVVAFRMLPEIVWAMPALGTFNLHASLLPQYRGAAPINFAIINGETTTGLTTFFLDKEIDTGKIIFQEKIDISKNDDAGTLHDRMMEKGSDIVLKTINSISNNEVTSHEQHKFTDEYNTLKIAPKIKKDFCRINWNNTPITIYNFVRGLSPYPASFSVLKSDREIQHSIKVFKATIISSSPSTEVCGKIITDEKTYLNVIAKTGIISILELQLSGKKRMSITDFLRGFQNINSFHFE